LEEEEGDATTTRDPGAALAKLGFAAKRAKREEYCQCKINKHLIDYCKRIHKTQ
jgi:hypothetical protein